MFRTKSELEKAKDYQLKRCKTTTNYTPSMGIIDENSGQYHFFTHRDKDCHTATKALIQLQQELKLK